MTDYLNRKIKSQIWNARVNACRVDPSRSVNPSLCHGGGRGKLKLTGSNGFIFTRELTKDGSI